MFFHPRHGGGELFLVILALAHAAGDFGHVHGLDAHAEPFFPHFGIDHRAGDAHRGAADGEVGFAAHEGHGEAALGEGEQFFLHVPGDLGVGGGLHILAINAEGGEALLGVAGEHGGEVNRPRALGAVETPHRLGSVGIHIHGLGTVAPAGRHGERDAHVVEFKLIGTGRGLAHAADAGVCDHALHRRAIRVAQGGAEKFRHGLGLIHGAGFERLAHAAEAAVDGGADADFREDCLFHDAMG